MTTRPSSTDAPPRIRVVARGDGLVVVDKPPGLPSTGRTLDDPHCAQHQLMAALRRRKVWAVHQLDADTSGLNLFVLRRALVATWSRRLANTHEAKRYLAICHGAPPRDTLFDAPIGRRRGPSGRTFPAIVAEGAGGKPAQSRIITLATAGRAALVEVRPLTGRTHQVRLHLAHLGHPLIGERLHRSPPCEAHPRHALHAASLVFDDVAFHSPLPDDLRALAGRLGLPDAPPPDPALAPRDELTSLAGAAPPTPDARAPRPRPRHDEALAIDAHGDRER